MVFNKGEEKMEFTVEEKVYLKNAIDERIRALEHEIVSHGYFGEELRKTWLNEIDILRSAKEKIERR